MSDRNTEDIIGALYDMVQDARSMPLSADKCILERDKVLDMLDEIIREAQEKANQLVTKEAIYVEAKKRSEELVSQTQNRINQLRKAANDYMDESLRQTEEVISNALNEVRDTRMKFRAVKEAQEQRKNANVDVEV